MSNSWFRNLFTDRPGTAPAKAAPKKARPRVEVMEDRVVPAVSVWDGEGGTLPTPNFNWGLALNWVGDVLPQAGDDIVFPAGLDATRKPPASIQNNVLIFPPNVIVDGNYIINSLTINDDNYRIDANPAGATPVSLRVQEAIVSNIPQTLGTLTGLSLLGPIGAGGATNMSLRFTSTGQTLLAVDGAPGILEISAPITEGTGVPVGLVKQGSGRMALSGNSTFSGTVTVTNGQLDVSGANALGQSGAGPTVNGTTVQAGATIGFAGGTIGESLQIQGTGVGNQGAMFGTIRALRTFGGNNIQGTPNAGLLDPGAATWSGGIALNPSASVGGTRSFAVTGQITGAGDLTKVGINTVTLSAANNYTGQTLINVGTLIANNDQALSPGSSTTVAAGATLALTDTRSIGETLFISGDGQGTDLNNNPLGALRLSGIAGATATYTGSVTLLANTSFGADVNQVLTVTTGGLGGAFDLRKVGQGQLVLPTANPNYTGNTFVNNGRLTINNALALGPSAALGGGAIQVTSILAPGGGLVRGTLEIQALNATPFNLSKPLTLNGAGFNTLGALNVVDASPTVGTNVVLDTGLTLAGPTSINIGTQTSNLSGLTINSVIDAPGGATSSFTRTGAGTLTLTNNNSYLGQTNLTNGLNIITQPNALGGDGGAGTIVSNGATLRFGAAVVTAEDLTLSGVGIGSQGALQATTGANAVSGLVTLQGGSAASADVNVTGAATALTFSNVVSGNADLNKNGAGELRFTGADENSYIGTTFVNGGTLTLAKANGADAVAGPVVVGTNAGGPNNSVVLQFAGSDQVPEARPSGQPLLVTVNANGLMNLMGFNETVGGLNLTGGEVQTGAGLLTLAGDVSTLSSPDTSVITGQLSLGTAGTRTFTVADNTALSPDLRVDAVVSGAGGLTKEGPGQLRLNAVNTYAGTTTVNVGTVTLGVAGALPNTPLVITAAGTVDVNGVANTVAALSGNGVLSFNGGTLTAGTNNQTTVFNGTLANGATTGGGLTKVGTGTLTVSNNSAGYTGTTNVNAGTLSVTGSIANSPINVGSGGTLGGTGTVGAITALAGSAVAPGLNGPGTLTVGGGAGATFATGATFAVDLNGLTAGTFDRLTMTGQAVLGGATLTLSLGNFLPGPGNTFVILTAGSVAGRLRSPAGVMLQEGDSFTVNGRAFTISYLGNSVTLTASQAATVALTSSATPSSPGQAVTFTATVAAVRPLDPTPQGTVQFRLGSPTGTLLATGTLDANGVATSGPITTLALGNNTIFAVYTSTNQFTAPAPGQLVQSVSLTSATTLTPQTPGPVIFGDTVSFLVAVAGTGPTPTGTVTFVNAATGQVVGTAALSGGQAAFNTNALPAGRITVQANYSGDANYRPSTGTAVQLVGRQTRLVTGSDVGPVAAVQVFDPRTRQSLGTFQPFDQYTLGVKVATGDVNGDGVDDIVVAAGQGAPGGHVKVFDGRTFQELFSFLSFPGLPGTQGFTGGVNVAVGDVNGDGKGDIIVGTGVDNDHVKVFSGANPDDVLLSFFAFSAGGGNKVGVTVAAGDVNNDGRADVIVGSATFAGHVKAFDGTSAAQIGSFFAFGAGYLGGINVASGDLDGDGIAELVVGATNVTHVKALDPRDGAQKASFFAYLNPDGGAAQFGVRVGAVDWDNDGLADIITGAGAAAPDVRVFDGVSLSPLDNFIARAPSAPTANTGVFVGGGTNPTV